jgi:uncharacterized protein (DUF488 family)
MTIHTLGHSRRSTDALLELSHAYHITYLADVRSTPYSRHNPQFNRETLAQRLAEEHIYYHHISELGGRRNPHPDSINTAWRSAGFRGYADYMQTEQFHTAVARLIESAGNTDLAIMCAEAVPWRCHRRLLTDALLARGVKVTHILEKKRTQAATLTDFAKVNGARVSYPAKNENQQNLL